MKAVIYCRVSTDRQVREGDGLRGQESRCRAFAAHRGIRVTEVFCDAGVSGGSAKRPGFFGMLNFLKSQKEETLVVIDDLNRLARDVVIHKSFRLQIARNGGRLACVNMQLEDSPEGQFVETVVAATAELEKEQNKRRVKDRQKARLEAGYWVFKNPVGYKYVQEAVKGKILVADEPSAGLISEAFRRYSTDSLLTQGDVLRFLQESKLINSRGNLQKLSYEDVKRILTRSIYAGFIEYPKWKVEKRVGKHEPIVTASVFEKVQEKLGRKKTIYRSGLENDFPLRGLLKCSACGSKLTGSWSKGKGGRYAYYRCPNTKAAILNQRA